MLRNPIISTTYQYQEKKNPASEHFDVNILGASFEEYSETHLFHHDILTRSIACKTKDEPITEGKIMLFIDDDLTFKNKRRLGTCKRILK